MMTAAADIKLDEHDADLALPEFEGLWGQDTAKVQEVIQNPNSAQ